MAEAYPPVGAEPTLVLEADDKLLLGWLAAHLAVGFPDRSEHCLQKRTVQRG